MNLWGITPEQLHHDTVSAENARNPVCLYTMDDVMSEIMLSVKPENLFEQTEPLESEMIPMYILTNQNKVNGAGVLARDGVLDKIGELLGSDFMSSHHRPMKLSLCRITGICRLKNWRIW